MAQANLNIPDTTSAQTRTATNAALHAVATQSAGPTAPPSPIEGQLWRQTGIDPEILHVYESGSWRVTEWGARGPAGPPGRDSTVPGPAGKDGGLDFDTYKETLIPGSGTSVIVDEDNERIAVNSLPQNGRWISIGRVHFTSTDGISTRRFFDTNIPAAATDKDKNMVKIYMTNSATLDTRNTEELEVIVELLGTSHSANTSRTLNAPSGASTVSIWRTNYTGADGNSYVRINLFRLDNLTQSTYFFGFTAFAPEVSNLAPGSKLLGSILKGDKGDPGRSAFTDSEIGDKAFSNPPSDLTGTEKGSVRSAIDAASEASAREGIYELSSATDRSAQDTLHIAERSSSLITEGVKYYISGGTVGGLKGKLIRRTNAAFGSVSEQNFADNFSTYWETILDAPAGNDTQLRDLQRKTDDISIFGPAATGWADATAATEGGFYSSGSGSTLNQAIALNDNQFVLTKTSGIGDHILARIPTTADPSQYRILFVSGRGNRQYAPALNTYRLIGSGGGWNYYAYQSLVGDDVASITLQLTPNADHIGTTRFSGTLTQDNVYQQVKEILQEGSNVTVTDNDTAKEITIASTGGGGGLSTVETDDTIEGNGSIADPLKITWRDEVIKNTNDSSRLKLVTGDIISGERREPSWGAVNSSGANGGLARNNGDGYWNETRAKAATYSAQEITASSNGDYFVARIPVSADPRQYVIREADTFSGTIDNPVNGMRRLGSDANWVYYIEDIRLFGTVTLRSSTHLVGQNVWAGGLRDGIVSTDAIADDAVTEEKLSSQLDDTIIKNTSDVSRLKLTTHDIIVGEHRSFSWGKVNSSGVEGGIAYAENWTLTTAKAATYAAPDVTLPQGGSFVCIRIPADTDPRNYFIREPSRIFGNIDAHLNEITRLGADDDWQYYWERVRWFGTISLESSSHAVGSNTWGGKLGAGVVDEQALDSDLQTRLNTTITSQVYGTIMKAGSSTALGGNWADLTLADTALVDIGSFSKSGSQLTINTAGQYVISAQVSATTNGSSSSSRVRIGVRISVTRAADNTTETSVVGSSYIRAQYTDLYTGIATVTQVFDVAAGDKVKVQAIAYKQSSGDSVTLNVAQCSLNVALSGGATGASIADRSITADKIANAAVIGRTIDAEAVSEEKIAADAITSSKIKASAITSGKIGNDAITTHKVANGTITGAKIANGAVTNNKLDSETQNRLLPSSLGTAGQVLTVNSSANGVEYADSTGGGGGWTYIDRAQWNQGDVVGTTQTITLPKDPNGQLYMFLPESIQLALSSWAHPNAYFLDGVYFKSLQEAVRRPTFSIDQSNSLELQFSYNTNTRVVTFRRFSSTWGFGFRLYSQAIVRSRNVGSGLTPL